MTDDNEALTAGKHFYSIDRTMDQLYRSCVKVTSDEIFIETFATSSQLINNNPLYKRTVSINIDATKRRP